MNSKPKSKKRALEEAARASKKEKYFLRLYVAGASSKSTRAITEMKELCENYLEGRYDLEVIDIYQQPVLAKGEQIIATPTLVKKLPLPLRRFIGNMTDRDRILVGLDLVRQSEGEGAKATPITPGNVKK